MPCFSASVSVNPAHAISGSVKTTGGDRLGRELDVAIAGDRIHRDASFVGRLVREHRLAGNVADRIDVRLAGAAALVGDDEAARIDFDADLVEPRDLRSSAAGRSTPARDRTSGRRSWWPPGLSLPKARNETVIPSFACFIPVTLVFSHTASQICSIRFARMLTRSRSAPGSRSAGHLDDRHPAAERA
jgi:hypothetical protein